MAVRAFECRAPGPGATSWFVALTTIEAMPPGTRIVRVRVGKDWLCATLDRSQVVEVEAMLARDAVPSDERDCPDCAPTRVSAAAPAVAEAPAPSAQVQAAAISLQGRRLVVVLVGRDLVDSPGEAAMAAADLSQRFGGVEVVLLGQDEDGTPHYHGAPELLDLLHGLPLDRMPWKAYPLR